MGGVAQSRSGRRYRRARRLRSGRRGVVAVIGTLLALLVFFALFGIFLTQFLPLWMNENEAAFTSAAQASYAQLKSDVDTQYIFGGPPTIGVPFTGSSQGIPLLAQPTGATLDFLPQTCPGGFFALGTSGASPLNYGQPVNSSYCVFENQSLSIGPGGYKNFSMEVKMGILIMDLPNRYYPAQAFSFEGDGVVQAQNLGYQLMAYAPPLNISKVGGNITVTSSFLQLLGNSSIVIGQGTQEVYSHLRFDQHIVSNGMPTTPIFNYKWEIGTTYPCAWSRFIQHLVNVSGVPSGQFTFGNIPYTGACYNPSGATTELWFKVTGVNYASILYAGVQMTIGIGSS